MKYLQLQLEKGSFPQPEFMEDVLSKMAKPDVNCTVNDRSIIIEYRNSKDTKSLINLLRDIVVFSEIL